MTASPAVRAALLASCIHPLVPAEAHQLDEAAAAALLGEARRARLVGAVSRAIDEPLED